MKVAAVGPPGVIPIQTPMQALRRSAIQYRGQARAALRTSRGLSFVATGSTVAAGSCMVWHSSAMPYRPMTTTSRLIPRLSSVNP